MNSDKHTARESGHSDPVHATAQVLKKSNTEKDDMSANRERFELRAVAPLDPDF